MSMIFVATLRAGWGFPEIQGLWMFAFLFGLDCRMAWLYWPL